MKINFTKKQFRILLDLVFLGDMVVNGWKTPDKEIEEYKEIQQYVYSFAKKFGYEDLVEYDKEFEMFFETRKYEETGVEKLMSEYDDQVFWEHLSSKLAEKDIYNKFKLKKDIDREELINQIWAREEEYNNEFEKNGLSNVKVDI